MTLCRCLYRHQTLPKDDPQLQSLDFLSASRYLRRVGLKVSDVRMKLGLNRIIHFLAETANKEQHGGSFIHNLERQDGNQESKLGVPSRMDRRENKENLTDLNEPQSFIGIEMSHSLLSELKSNQEHYLLPATTTPAPCSLSKAFLVKQVVTKNTLDDYGRHVRFASSIKSQFEEDRDQIVEKLQEQNRVLETCLKNIFTFFEEKQLLHLQGQLQRSQLNDVAEQLTSNFIDYTHDIQERMANLSAKSSLLQQTIHNMSISLRLEKQQEPLAKAVQTEEEGEVQERMKSDLATAETAAKRAQLILYLKQEEIASLRIIIADLQNKLNSCKSEERPRSKSYKKFFEITGQDLSQSTR